MSRRTRACQYVVDQESYIRCGRYAVCGPAEADLAVQPGHDHSLALAPGCGFVRSKCITCLSRACIGIVQLVPLVHSMSYTTY